MLKFLNGILHFIPTQVDEYLMHKGSQMEQEIAADIMLQILDVLLKSEYSLNNQQVSFEFSFRSPFIILNFAVVVVVELNIFNDFYYFCLDSTRVESHLVGMESRGVSFFFISF